MRNRICPLIMILVSMLLAACNESTSETSETTSGQPEVVADEIPETSPQTTPTRVEVTQIPEDEPVTVPPAIAAGEPVVVGAFLRAEADDEYVWVTSAEEGTLARIDPASGEAARVMKTIDGAMDVAVLDGHVWLMAESWLEIDRETMEIVGSMPRFEESNHFAAAFGSLWVAVESGQAVANASIIRIDPHERTVTARIPIEGVCLTPGAGQTPSLLQLEAYDDAIWALTFCDGDSGYVNVYRIDPDTDTAIRVAVVSGEDNHSIGAHAMTVTSGIPWLVTFDLESGGEMPSRVVRIDPDSGTSEELGKLGRWPRGILYAKGYLWITDCADATVTQVDPSTGDVVGDPTVIATPAPEDLEEADEFSCLSDAVLHGSTMWVCSLTDGAIIPVELGS